MTPRADCKNLAPLHCMEQFRRMDERLAEVISGIAEIRSIYETQQKRIDRVEKTLYGNGNTGLCTKVSAILWITTGIAGFVGVLLAKAISSAVAAWIK